MTITMREPVGGWTRASWRAAHVAHAVTVERERLGLAPLGHHLATWETCDTRYVYCAADHA